MRTKKYGYYYDKRGNCKIVNPPVYGNLKPVKEKPKTQYGAIPKGVGFSVTKNP